MACTRGAGEHTGVLTGKRKQLGRFVGASGSKGFGCVYFAKEMLATEENLSKGKELAISGFGNVAWVQRFKATELGGKVVTISGPDGYVYDPEGISGKKKIRHLYC